MDIIKNMYKGKRCFIIGTAPSIKEQDLSLLKHDYVMGVSKLFYNNSYISINPSFHVYSPILSYHSQCYSENTFLKMLQDMNNLIPETTELFFHIGDKCFIETNNLFVHNKIHWTSYNVWNEFEQMPDFNLTNMPNIWSVSESAIQIALYLGFEEIFLVGFDHDWFNGLLNYFDKNIMKHHAINEKEFVIQHGLDSELQMRRHAYIFSKYKKLYDLEQNIYNANANANTYVDTFPKVEYEKLFQDNYKQYIKESKNNFTAIKSVKKGDKKEILLSKQLNSIAKQINTLNSNKTYVIYGQGVVGKIIYNMLEQSSRTFVDKAITLMSKDIKENEVYHPLNLSNMHYDNIIISVLGREEEIIRYLVEELNIDKHKIITLDIG
ncbi:MAG: hypothetical protein AB7D96_03745 [Arcobacteraceae bacterium]